MDQERRPRRAGPVERPGAVGGKRDLNRRQRVQDLIDAGLALFLQRGIEAVTIDESEFWPDRTPARAGPPVTPGTKRGTKSTRPATAA